MRIAAWLFCFLVVLGVVLPEKMAAASNGAPLSAELAPNALPRLRARLEAIAADGLDPRHYALPSTEPSTAHDRDVLLARAEAVLRDLVLGRVAQLPGRVDLRRDPQRADFPAWRHRLLSSADPASVIDAAAALHPDNAPIKAELARLRQLAAAGSWPLIRGNLQSTLEPGAHDPLRVPQLRARLAVHDPALAVESAVYDAPLQAALRAFQAAEGLEADGRIGPMTWSALNTPIEAKIGQLRVGLDMRRALPRASVERRIDVNIPHYRLRLLEGEQVVQDMAVIVGRPDRATPMLDLRMTAVQFNPSWGVPDRNAREDLLPRFRRDPAGTQARGFRLYQRVEGELVEVDATTVDFSGYTKDHFPYYIRQDAGEANALGRIKFVMPNRDDIYMHDTPDRYLFRRPDRAFSSGCIRLERPMDLLAEAFSGMSAWDRTRIDRVLESRVTQGVALTRSIPVRLHYDTVVVESGMVLMRRDIYGLDAAYLRALEAPQTATVAEAMTRR